MPNQATAVETSLTSHIVTIPSLLSPTPPPLCVAAIKRPGDCPQLGQSRAGLSTPLSPNDATQWRHVTAPHRPKRHPQRCPMSGSYHFVWYTKSKYLHRHLFPARTFKYLKCYGKWYEIYVNVYPDSISTAPSPMLIPPSPLCLCSLRRCFSLPPFYFIPSHLYFFALLGWCFSLPTLYFFAYLGRCFILPPFYFIPSHLYFFAPLGQCFSLPAFYFIAYPVRCFSLSHFYFFTPL